MIKTNKKVLMIWTANNKSELGGVGYYRITSPAKKLKELGYDIDVVAGFDLTERFRRDEKVPEIIDVYSNVLEQYDLIWMKHTDNKDAIAAIFSMKDKFNCKVVWDFDDDLFNLRENHPGYKEMGNGTDCRAYIGSAITFCDALTVSTEYLKKSLTKFLKDVYGIKKDIYVCPNFVNIEEWSAIKYRPSNSPVIGYYGSTTHNDDFDLIKPVLYDILAKYPNVRFETIGMFTENGVIEMFRDCPDVELLKRVCLKGGTNGWAGFPDMLLRQNWDISIAPLIDDEFNRAKSNIKWMESSMKSIPTVCSDVQPYTESVTKETGFLCKEKDWFKTLCKLIEKPDLRVKIGKQARQHIIDNWNADVKIKDWKKALDKLLQ
jgi:glycosyltransferase involved in cell wall biosynthesis